MAIVEIELRIEDCPGAEECIQMAHVPRVGDSLELGNTEPGEQFGGEFLVTKVKWGAGYDDGSAGCCIVLRPVD